MSGKPPQHLFDLVQASWAPCGGLGGWFHSQVTDVAAPIAGLLSLVVWHCSDPLTVCMLIDNYVSRWRISTHSQTLLLICINQHQMSQPLSPFLLECIVTLIHVIIKNGWVYINVFAKKIRVLQISVSHAVSVFSIPFLYHINTLPLHGCVGCIYFDSKVKWIKVTYKKVNKKWGLPTIVVEKWNGQTFSPIMLELHLILIWCSTWQKRRYLAQWFRHWFRQWFRHWFRQLI